MNKLIEIGRKLFSNKTPVLNENEDELSDKSILLIKLNHSSHQTKEIFNELERYANELDELTKSKNETLSKAEQSGVLHHISKRIENLESEILLNLELSISNFNKSKKIYEECNEDFLKAIQDGGDFEYKKYMKHSLQRSRDTMPQINSDQLDDLILHFQGNSKDAKVTKKKVKVSDLKPTQDEINENKVLSMLKDALSGDLKLDDKYVVSKDKYCIDGHHRWSTQLEINPEEEVEVYQINLPIKELLRRVNLMKISKKVDIDDKEIKKAIDEYHTGLLDEILDDKFEKGRKAMPIGTVSGGRKKVADGRWVKQTEGKVKYDSNDELSKENKEIEKRFGDYLNKHYEEAKAIYIAKFGDVLNTDNVRELSDDYNKNKSELSSAVHEPASSFIKELYKEKLKEPLRKGKSNLVYFTGGGTGAGKTSSLMGAEQKFHDKSKMVFDTNMNGFESSVKK